MDPICIKQTGKYGKGVYATRAIKQGELIEQSPVLVAQTSEWEHLKNTVLFDYCFTWGFDDEDIAIALGYGSLYNHSFNPNATFTNNPVNQSIDFFAITDIRDNDEITINYNQDPDDCTPLWFDVID